MMTLRLILAVSLVSAVACSPAKFSGLDQQSKSEVQDLRSPPPADQTSDDPIPADQSPLPEPSQNLACNYPEYVGPLNTPTRSECHSTSRPEISSSDRRSDGATYILSMYNASNLSHGLVPATHRAIVAQKIAVSAALPPNSVDLVLYSYEPVRWRIEGNLLAIRSVHVRGYHCAFVEGVPAAAVSIDTYEQGADANSSRLPLSLNIAQDFAVYEGSCAADNRFSIQ